MRRRVAGVTCIFLLLAVRHVSGGPQRGLAVSPGELEPAASRNLGRQIELARAEHPEIFEAVAEIVAGYPVELGPPDRSGKVRIEPHLMALGPDALYPMLEVLAVREPPNVPKSESTLVDLQIGVLYAVGTLRDPRAEQVLRAVVLKPRLDQRVRDVAAVALSRLPTDVALGALSGILEDRDDVGAARAAYKGLGRVRRLEAVETLARAGRTRLDNETAAVLARALGDAGSASVWEIVDDGVRESEEREAREIAVESVFYLFETYDDPEVRSAVERAVCIIDHESTLSRIAALREKASPDLQRNLDVLEDRYRFFKRFSDHG